MEEKNNKNLKNKVVLGVVCGILIGCIGTTGFFKYQQSKNPAQGGMPPMGEFSEDMIPEGMTQEEFEAQMKDGKNKPDKPNSSNENSKTNEDVTQEAAE